MVLDTNEEKNGDLRNPETDLAQKFSSLEDGEVREEDDEEDYGDY